MTTLGSTASIECLFSDVRGSIATEIDHSTLVGLERDKEMRDDVRTRRALR
jgi:hypothetical protein